MRVEAGQRRQLVELDVRIRGDTAHFRQEALRVGAHFREQLVRVVERQVADLEIEPAVARHDVERSAAVDDAGVHGRVRDVVGVVELPWSRNARAMFVRYVTISQAICTALTPSGVSDECASWPRTRQRQLFLPLCATTSSMPVGSPTMQPERSDAAPDDVVDQPAHADAADLLVVGQREMHGTRETAAQELGDEREPRRRKALHVGDAAADHPVADQRGLERIGVPRLAVHRHDVRVPGKHDASGRRLPSRAGSVANRFALRALVVERERAFGAVRLEVARDPVDQREVRLAARRVEGDQRADEVPREEVGRGQRGGVRAHGSPRGGSVHDVPPVRPCVTGGVASEGG